jgi:hypothetical protein
MNNQARRLVLGFTVILACVAGLLAVSTLVPEVGCKESSTDFLTTATRVRLTVPDTAPAGHLFSINGTLEKGTQPINLANPKSIPLEPFPQQIVTITTQSQSINVTTDEEGRFSTDLSLRFPGTWFMTAAYAGDKAGYYYESRDTKKIEIIGNPIIVTGFNYLWIFYLAAGITLTWGGILLLQNLKHRRQEKRAAIKVTKQRYCKHIWPEWLPYALGVLAMAAFLFAIYPRQKAIVHEGETISPRIITKTRLKLPSRTESGQAFDISGKLTKIVNDIETPLTGQEIEIWLADPGNPFAIGAIIKTLQTDNLGRFNGEMTLEQSGQYEISAVFDDTGELFLESSDVRHIAVGIGPDIWVNWRSPGWLSIIIGTTVLTILVISSIFFIRRRKKKPADQEVDESSEATLVPADQPDIKNTHSTSDTVRISFPLIPAQMPDVWGKDDDFLIVFAVDGIPQMLAQYSLDIELESDTSIRSPITPNGHASHTHAFHNTGRFNIQAVLVKEVRNGYLPASRMVRIVDYREEIVRLYNEMLATLKSQGFPLTSKMTAREVEARLSRAYPALSNETTNTLVSVFEEANYSLHPIARPSYEKMFLAVKKIEQQINS